MGADYRCSHLSKGTWIVSRHVNCHATIAIVIRIDASTGPDSRAPVGSKQHFRTNAPHSQHFDIEKRMDDLLDLSWSDKPASGAGSKPSTPAGAGAFDFLSKPSNPNAPDYSGRSTPLVPSPRPSSAAAGLKSGASTNGNLTPSATGSGRHTPLYAGAAAPKPAAGGDAFSDLLGGSGGASSGKNLSMAERAQKLAAEKAEKERREREQWGGFLDGFESGPKPVRAAAPGAVNQASPVPSQPMLAPTPKSAAPRTASPLSERAPSSTPSASKSGSFWNSDASKASTPAPAAVDDLSDFLGGATKPAQIKPTGGDLLGGTSGGDSAPSGSSDPWDFDALDASIPAASDKPTGRAPERSSDFDYGNDFAEDDDDLLGGLGSAPAVSRYELVETDAQHREPRREAPTRDGATSPPPHIVGQIVEMGFSPAQARAALAATPTGLDVQAAIESLVGVNGGREQDDRDLEMDDERIAREMQAREQREADQRARHAARRAGPSRDPTHRRPQQPDDPQDQQTVDQAERLIAQASEIGSNMLFKATSLWNTGRERAQKLYEEQRKAYEEQQAAKRRPADGRPRWMVEAEEAQRAEANQPNQDDQQAVAADGFQDSDNDEAPPPPSQTAGRAPTKPTSQQRLDPSAKQQGDLLFAEQPQRAYVSPNRRPKGRGAATATPPLARSSTPAAPPPARQLVPASNSETSAAAQHKNKGNEHFKLGRFTEAEAAYSAAIAALPGGHIHLVPLYNNRAATWLKLGESTKAVQDCAVVIDIVGPNYHPSKEAPLPPDCDVRLGDALVKATSKRAQAHEMGEKWKLALADWERVLSYDAALGGQGSKAQASEGIRRAKAMLSGGPSGPSNADTPRASKPATPRPVSRPADVGKSAAVAELRKAAQAQEKEDEARLAVKDAVDAKLDAWRKGKETNLRALLASLDLVLWDPVLLKVGMHELVTDKQVKIKYMKVIARLHPDKLAGMNTTPEQRLLANGVFGQLSEA